MERPRCFRRSDRAPWWRKHRAGVVISDIEGTGPPDGKMDLRRRPLGVPSLPLACHRPPSAHCRLNLSTSQHLTKLAVMNLPDHGHPPSVRTIHGDLRRRIIVLDLMPGSRLSENELAEHYGTSRAPVREALIRLGEEGFIDVRPQRGSFVSRISLAAVARARFVREAIEAAAARRAAEIGASTALLNRARALIVEQRHFADDARGFIAADESFHRLLAEASGIAGLWAAIEREKAQLDRVRFLSLPEAPRHSPIIEQHEDILDAIEARDPDTAEAAMRRHLSQVLAVLPALATARPDLIVTGDPTRPAHAGF